MPAAPETSPIDVLERAFLLVAREPSAVLTHYLGSVPFLIGLLWFVDQMRTSRSALDRCLPEACGVALLYVWMNYCRARFSQGLRARLDGKVFPEWTIRDSRRILSVQARFQGLKLFVMPIAAASVIAWPWTTAFFRNITNLGAPKAARAQASLWQRQNGFIAAFIALISAILFVNIGLVLIIVPQLARTFSGIENPFTRSPSNALNTSLLCVDIGLCWLLLDPIVEAVYAIRCFEGQSLRTGEDLLSRLRGMAAIALLLLIPMGAHAQLPGSASAISKEQWKQSVNQALQSSRYDWAVPRVQPKNGETAFWRGMEAFAQAFERGARAIKHGINVFMRWLARALGLDRDVSDSPGSGRGGPSGHVGAMLILLTGLVAASLLVVVWRMWPRSARKPAAKAGATLSAIDLAREDLLASQLPEDQWFELAERCLSGGEMRLGLRALFLASLAYLDGRTLISIHAAKSNREYLHELGRNARSRARDPRTLVNHFFSNLGSFERAWYGMHDVSAGEVEAFRANLSEMRASAGE